MRTESRAERFDKDQVEEPPSSRIDSLAGTGPGAATTAQVRKLLGIATRGVSRTYLPREGTFAHTARLVAEPGGDTLRIEGRSLRYAAITALGLATLTEDLQKQILDGSTAAALAARTAELALTAEDSGSVALAAWASAELGQEVSDELRGRVVGIAIDPKPVETVVASWTLSALIAMDVERGGGRIGAALEYRIRSLQYPSGLFPHALPDSAISRLRRHVGCFADQVYPIQALSRFHAATGQPDSLAAADSCARRICSLQGVAGQWWWHYDVRTGEVVEGYPIYNVHQHAMAPMALHELREAGGLDLTAGIAHGVNWTFDRPEIPGSLIDERYDMVWRSVRRREPVRASRSVKAAVSSIVPSAHLAWADSLAPAIQIDRECRPYEYGWMFYAWNADGVIKDLNERGASDSG